MCRGLIFGSLSVTRKWFKMVIFKYSEIKHPNPLIIIFCNCSAVGLIYDIVKQIKKFLLSTPLNICVPIKVTTSIKYTYAYIAVKIKKIPIGSTFTCELIFSVSDSVSLTLISSNLHFPQMFTIIPINFQR